MYFSYFLCSCGSGQRAREEESTRCSQLAPQSPPQHLQPDSRPALPAGALWSNQPDQTEGHSEGGHAYIHTKQMISVGFPIVFFTSVISDSFSHSSIAHVFNSHRFLNWKSLHPSLSSILLQKSNSNRPNKQGIPQSPIPPTLHPLLTQFPPRKFLLSLLRNKCHLHQMKVI